MRFLPLFVDLSSGLVAVVGTINAALNLYFVYQDNRRASIDVQREKAGAASQTIESFIKEIERQIGWVAYAQFDALPAEHIGHLLKQADLVEQWITDLRALAFTMLENDAKIDGYKLVAKRGVRQWVDEEKAAQFLGEDYIVTTTALMSPAQAEKLLKKRKRELPAELVVSVSSGSTLASEDDPRPAVLNVGKQLSAALGKLA